MRKPFFLLIGIILLIVSCGPRLSENDAKAVIEKELEYPKTISTLINFWDWKDQPITWQAMLDYLVKNGDLVYSHTSYNNKIYKPTAKGAVYIKSDAIRVSDGNNNMSFVCAFAQEFVTGIKEVLIDEKNNTAKVKYLVTLKPYEPYYTKVYAKSNECRVYNIKLGEVKEKEIVLKKFDKGWRANN